MKKIGHEVLFLHTGEKNPRNGEGTFARLKDGSILFAYTDYCGDSGEDHGVARISGCVSPDEGETWSAPRVLLTKDEGDQNIMSASLLRMANGDLGIVYLRKQVMPDTGIICMPVFRRSSDEGQTWSDWICCVPEEGYYCTINDGVTQLPDGRILVPMSCHGLRYDAFGTCTLDLGEPAGGTLQIACSSDDGATWEILSPRLVSPYKDTVGLGEPGVYGYKNGDLWLYCRTGYGHQYQSFSRDGGKTWSSPTPNFGFTSPDCPMRVRRVGQYTAAVFNPQPYTCLRTDSEVWRSPRRTPLVCTLSRDDGHSFSDKIRLSVNGGLDDFTASCYLLEDDQNESYCYPAIFPVEDGFLVAYYHSDGTPYCLRSTKISKVRYDEF